MELSQIQLKELFWLQRRSHCSVINLAHVGEPMAPAGAIMAANCAVFACIWAPFCLSGAKASNGSLGSPKKPL